ncbi:MAG: hypothetical protein IJL62_01290 [Clostridia bacterium]|nr:hypothetical protein [Clostridia bacterium]
MWTARILILVLLLLSGGGWFDRVLFKREKIALLCLLPVVFGLTLVPTVTEPTVRLCFAPCAFLLLTAGLCPTDHPFGALFAALSGGLLGWELCDAFPLFFEQGFLIAAPTLLVSALFCRDANAKALAIAAAPFVMLLIRMAGDYTLFRSTVLELGNGDALCAQSLGLLLLILNAALRERISFRLRRAHGVVPLIPRT